MTSRFDSAANALLAHGIIAEMGQAVLWDVPGAAPIAIRAVYDRHTRSEQDPETGAKIDTEEILLSVPEEAAAALGVVPRQYDTLTTGGAQYEVAHVHPDPPFMLCTLIEVAP